MEFQGFSEAFLEEYLDIIRAVRESEWSCVSAAPCFVFIRSDESVNIAIVSGILVLDHCLSQKTVKWLLIQMNP